MFFLPVKNCAQRNGFTASRLIFEVGLSLLHLLKYLGLFLNRLIFEGRLTFEEIRYIHTYIHTLPICLSRLKHRQQLMLMWIETKCCRRSY